MPKARPKPKPIVLSRKVIFLHIAKTAGTSIVHFFQRRLPQDAVCSHGDFLSFPREPGAFKEALLQYQFMSGHFCHSDVAQTLPDVYSFTFLRDPVDRVLSFYKFCMHPDMQRQFAAARAARDLGLEGFLGSTLPEVCEMLDNQQTWQLARGYWQQDRTALAHLPDGDILDMAKTHLDGFNHVGFTETFDEDFQHILSDLDICETVPSVRQFRTPEPVTSNELPAKVLASLRERLALDYALLDHVAARRAAGQYG